MFPYPSGDGLHTGHSENYTAPDILARYRRSKGINVLQPMGWDAFGLPTEQYAVETGIHPRAITARNVERYRRQIKRHGFAIDWDREINTTDPGYYRWTQWIFLQLFKHGLAYVDEKPVWWCPALRTVLANEEVVKGRSERGNHSVERRNLRQWVLRITAYADQLLEGLDDLDWPNSTKRQQISWIGRSVGTEVDFAIDGHPGEKLRVFTTRPDTLFGATYMVLSPEHILVGAVTRPEFRFRMDEYLRQAATKSDLDRTDLAKEKTGVPTGSFAINPVNNRKIPIWVADYVLMTYGTGAIMAVPAHDERDFEFAQRFSLPVVRVIECAPADDSNRLDPLPYTGSGRIVDSGKYTGMYSPEGIKRITEDLDKAGCGRGAINFKLHDWLFSRQRYWGEPFPIIWVDEVDYQHAQENREGEIAFWLPDTPVSYREGERVYCALPVPAGRLPLELPEMESFAPSGTGESPLANASEWLNVWVHLDTGECVPASEKAPASGEWARGRRETDTMPNWAGSCWYHLRYCDSANSENLAGRRRMDVWKVPDFYIGGAEHGVLHLLYARFWHRFLFDLDVVSEPEPYKRLVHQGTILGEDGEKMSKSRGNVVSSDSVIDLYGADTLRLYLMFMGPLQDTKPWSTTGIQGVHRFLRRLWRLLIDRKGNVSAHVAADGIKEAADTEGLLHETIKKVTEDIESLRFNTAISQMMILLNHAQKAPSITLGTARKFLQLLAPFAPHIAEELWERLGKRSSIVLEPWPAWDDAKLATDDVTIVFQINGRVRGDARIPRDSDREQILALAREQPRVARHLEGKTIRKVIYVPEKILNLVVS